MILVKIDVTKIDKARLFKGAKGTYLDLVLFETENDKYGNDYRAMQGVTKEERQNGVKGVILGSGKTIGQSKPRQERGEPVPAPESQYPPAEDDIPF